MVKVEENEERQSKSNGHGSPAPVAPAGVSPPPTAAAILAQCLKLLRGQSDEHKFAGLVMVTKHVPALTASVQGGSSSSSQNDGGGGQLRQICSAVGPAFLHRLLRTPGDKSSGGGGGGGGGLSVYQQIALGVLAAFFRDESLVPKFLPVAPALVRALRAADAVAQTQSLCDALYCVQAIAGVPDGMERLLRAGAAAAVVSRLAAASGDRTARGAAAQAGKAGGDRNEGGGSGSGGGSDSGVEETKTGGGGTEAKQATAAAAAAAATAPPPSSPEGFGGGNAEKSSDGGSGASGGDGPAQRAEALAFAFVGRALEASGGNCLGPRELTAVAEAFRDDPTPGKFGFMDLLLRWSSVLERDGGGEASPAAGGGSWTRTGAFPAALREGLLQALHGAAEDERRDSALALLALLLRAVGQDWAVEDEGDGEDDHGGGGGGGGVKGKKKKEIKRPARRKRGTFVAFAVRCAAGEVRILLDEALSLFVPAAARGGGGVGAANGDGGDDEAGPGTGGQRARGAMGPAGADPSIGIAAEIAGANARAAAATSEAAAAAAAASGAGKGAEDSGEEAKGAAPAPRPPLAAAQLKAIKEQRAARLLRMVPVGLGVAESTIAFLCGGGEPALEGEGAEEGEGGSRNGRWDELPIGTLQDLQKTLVSLFGCVLDFFSEIRRWIVVTPAARAATAGERGAEEPPPSTAEVPSIVDLWAMQRLGLECSRVLGVWVAEDPESLPQRFLEALPVLLALNAGAEAPDSDDEESDDDDDDDDDDYDGGASGMTAPTLAAFPGAARFIAAGSLGGQAAATSAAAQADESLHNVLRAMLALSYEATPLAAMVEEGVTARLACLAAAGPPAIAALLGRSSGGGGGGGASSFSSLLPPPEQVSEAVRSPLITACGLLTNILTSAGHLAWPENPAARRRGGGQQQRHPPAPSHPVLGHPGMGECLASLAEVAGAAGAARRAGGGARWRLVAAHATLVVMTVARAATPGNGLAPARGLADRKARWSGGEDGGDGGDDNARRGRSSTVWEGMARAVDEALGSLSVVPGKGLIGGGGGEDVAEEEEASYEEGAIWQWCLECAREMEAASGGAAGNPYVSSGVVPRRVLKSLIEASSDGRI